MVAQTADLDWRVVIPRTDDFEHSLEPVIRTQEEPFYSPSVFLQYFVMRTAREIGCTVMLDGQGGDETLLGYERYYPAYLLSLPWRHMLPKFISSTNHSRLTTIQLLQYMFYFTIPAVRIQRLRQKFKFLRKKYRSLLGIDHIRTMAQAYRDITLLQTTELMKYQLPRLLRYEDKNSMMHSIETRLPFIDYTMVEVSLSLANNLKIKDGWTKYVLRKSIEYALPSEITWRKHKIGFEAPVHVWLADTGKILVAWQSSRIVNELVPSDLLEHINDLHILWSLYNIALWEKVFDIEIDI